MQQEFNIASLSLSLQKTIIKEEQGKEERLKQKVACFTPNRITGSAQRSSRPPPNNENSFEHHVIIVLNRRF
jgi:hypothetical protein